MLAMMTATTNEQFPGRASVLSEAPSVIVPIPGRETCSGKLMKSLSGGELIVPAREMRCTAEVASWDMHWEKLRPAGFAYSLGLT